MPSHDASPACESVQSIINDLITEEQIQFSKIWKKYMINT